MMDRVERVERTKGVYLNPEESFSRKQGYAHKEKKENFSYVLKKELEKKEEPDSERDAYIPSLRPTQSLFYTGKARIDGVRDKVRQNERIG